MIKEGGIMTISVKLDNDIKCAADNLFGGSEPRQSMEDAINDTLNDTNLYGPFDTAKEMIGALLED
jgi:hypothetical protein